MTVRVVVETQEAADPAKRMLYWAFAEQAAWRAVVETVVHNIAAAVGSQMAVLALVPVAAAFAEEVFVWHSDHLLCSQLAERSTEIEGRR
jgi:hypothetical protein